MSDRESLLTDTLETLRGKVRRAVRENRELLIDSLDALNKSKADVVHDHIERVLDSYNKLLDCCDRD